MANYSVRITTAEERSTAVNDNFKSTVTINGRAYKTQISGFAVLGYIPGISIITGLFRLVIGMVTYCINPEWSTSQIVRGTLEMCCIGIVYLPFDAGWLKCVKVSD